MLGTQKVPGMLRLEIGNQVNFFILQKGKQRPGGAVGLTWVTELEASTEVSVLTPCVAEALLAAHWQEVSETGSSP